MSFRQGGPDSDVAAIVFDMTGLPDPSQVREVGRIRPEGGGGFHNIFMYKHSDGRPILMATHRGAKMFDMRRFVEERLTRDTSRPSVSPGSGEPLHGLPRPLRRVRPSHAAGQVLRRGRRRILRLGHLQSGGAEARDHHHARVGLQLGHTFTPTPDGRFAWVRRSGSTSRYASSI